MSASLTVVPDTERDPCQNCDVVRGEHERLMRLLAFSLLERIFVAELQEARENLKKTVDAINGIESAAVPFELRAACGKLALAEHETPMFVDSSGLPTCDDLITNLLDNVVCSRGAEVPAASCPPLQEIHDAMSAAASTPVAT